MENPGNPWQCLYHNPHRYSLVEWAKWARKYMNYKIYEKLSQMAKITGYRLVKRKLFNENSSKYGITKERSIKIGREAYYVVKEEELPKSVKKKLKEIV